MRCLNDMCKHNRVNFKECGLAGEPILLRFSDDMHPYVMACLQFKEGEPDRQREIRDAKGYYPGQLREPT